jgi:hypothetical protein
MNTRQATNLQQIPPPSLADCCLICMSVANGLVLCSFATTNEDGCCLLLCLGARQAVDGLELAPGSKNICCVSHSPSPSPTVDCYIPRSIPALSISYLIDSKGSGANRFNGPPSRAHLVPKSSLTMKSPHLCASTGAISLAPRQKAREGISDGVGWLLWPSSDDLKATGHGFGGRSVIDGRVVCEKVRYFCTYSHKKIKVHTNPQLCPHVGTCRSSFVQKCEYAYCRA